MKDNLPKVALIGRPNSGKSTLFNRLVRERRAIEHHQPGVTRDYLRGRVMALGLSFEVWDTGGLLAGDSFENIVQDLFVDIIKKIDLALVLIDTPDGINTIDHYIIDTLRQANVPWLLVANKIDSPQRAVMVNELYALSAGEPLAISAAHGIGISTLIEAIKNTLAKNASQLAPNTTKKNDDHQEFTAEVKIALVGRPNVGKSTLFNLLVAEKRMLTSPIAGTTRDAIDTEVAYGSTLYRFIDTAGLRRKARVNEAVEFYSTRRSIQALEQADIAILLIDSVDLITEQDQRIAGLIEKSGCACLVIFNKWDKIPPEGQEQTKQVLVDELSSRLFFFKELPCIFMSALGGEKRPAVFTALQKIRQSQITTIATSQLTDILRKAVEHRPAPRRFGKVLKIYYAVQTGHKPFVITCFVNDPRCVIPAYRRYLENQLRDHYSLPGIPLRFVFRSRAR